MQYKTFDKKQKILDYYKNGACTYPSYVANKLGLGLKETVIVTKELITEGKLK